MSPRTYRVHGLRLYSDFPLLHARGEVEDGDVDVHIRFGDAPQLPPLAPPDAWLHGDRHTLQFMAQGAGTFTCIDGHTIVVSPEPQATAGQLELYCLGTALGIVHYQRGDFPIHGAFLSRNGITFGVCGHSGEGKSTLAYTLAQAGCTLLTDDVAIVRNVDGMPTVFAESTHVKLRDDAAHAMDIATTGLDPVDPRRDKHYVPIPAPQAAPPPVLRAMIYLRSAPHDGDFIFEPLPLVAALANLREQTYRPFLIPLLAGNQHQLEFGVQISSRVRSFRFTRPRALARLRESGQFLLKQLEDALG